MKVSIRTEVVPAAIPRFEKLQVTFATRRALLEHVTIGSDSCRLFWPTRAILPARIPLQLDLGFAGEPERFNFLGEILRSIDDMGSAARSGLLIEVRGEDTLRFARAYARARGRPDHFARRDTLRAPCRFEAALEGEAFKLKNLQLSDLSRRGAFVATRLRAPRGMAVRLEIRLGWLRHISALARVAWAGTRGSECGLGLEFLELEPRHAQRLASTLRGLDAGAVVGT